MKTVLREGRPQPVVPSMRFGQVLTSMSQGGRSWLLTVLEPVFDLHVPFTFRGPAGAVARGARVRTGSDRTGVALLSCRLGS